jgi:GrpB-like predicted nucleotidyltransferase (UPF0157 family)
MIGLQRGTVTLAEYDPAWTNEFEQEKRLLQQVFKDRVLAIEHIGSTAVPGLAAKPIIDIEVGLCKLDDYKELVPLVEALGYHFMPDRIFDEYVFMPKGPEERRTHYLHFAAVGSNEWNNVIHFRDILRANPKIRDEYAAIKSELAAANANDRSTYTTRKAEFICQVLRKDT